MSSNVGLTFAYRIFDGIATGIWQSAIFSTYVFNLMGGTDAANEVRRVCNESDADPEPFWMICHYRKWDMPKRSRVSSLPLLRYQVRPSDLP